MKKSVFAGLLMIPFMCLAAMAQNEGEIDYDKVDRSLFRKLKAQSGKDDGQIYQDLGFSYFKQGDFNRAMYHFEKATSADPDLYWSWYYMGLLNIAAPEGFFKKAIQVNKDFAPAYYWLGMYYCRTKMIKESIRYFEDYLKAARNRPEEAERAASVKKFIAAMKKGETDYGKIIAGAS